MLNFLIPIRQIGSTPQARYARPALTVKTFPSRQVPSKWYAVLALGEASEEATGRTQSEAIGRLIKRCPAMFGVTIEEI